MKFRQYNITKGLLIVYIIVMTWVILFKMQLDISLLKTMNFRSINLIPFGDSLIINGNIDISEIILNIVVFIPFGVYLCMLKDEWSFAKKVAPVFGVSLVFETLQYIFAIGASDITDLIGNTLGGVIGIVAFALLSKTFKNKTKLIINVLALIGTILVIMFLGLIIIVNMYR